jgi:hypothetical protein
LHCGANGSPQTWLCEIPQLRLLNGTFGAAPPLRDRGAHEEAPMHGIIYLVGLIVVIMFILSVLGLR